MMKTLLNSIKDFLFKYKIREIKDRLYWILNKYSKSHKPDVYIEFTDKELFLVNSISQFKRDIKILEIGCAAGRVLKCLFENNFKNLSAVEISNYNIKTLLKYNKEVILNGNIFHGDALDELMKLKSNSFDLIICKGILFNISNHKMDLLSKEMTRVSKKYILIFEGINYGKYIHNYESLFSRNNFVLDFKKKYDAMNENKNKTLFNFKKLN